MKLSRKRLLNSDTMSYPFTYRTEHSVTETTNSSYGSHYEAERRPKVKIQPDLLQTFRWIDSKRDKLIKNLSHAISIPSVSGCAKHRKYALEMVEWAAKWLVRLGAKLQRHNYGKYVLDGEEMNLPPILLGTLGRDYRKYTILLYAHLDVKQCKDGKWSTDPFKMEIKDNKLYGCGAAKNKGPLMSWFHAIQSFKACGIDMPVNIKFVLESMHRQGSPELEHFLFIHRLGFLADVDYIVVCDSEWLGPKLPCLTFGCIGRCRFTITVEQADKNKKDPKIDIEEISNKIATDEETILVDNFNECMIPLTPDEEKWYDRIDFDIKDVRLTLPDYKQSWSKVKLLMNFWRLPSVTMGDIEECICEKKDEYPKKVKREYIFKIVPNQTPKLVEKAVTDHVKNVVKQLGIENNVECVMTAATRPWIEDFKYVHYEAARRATIQVYKEEPNMIREDTDFPVLDILGRVIQKRILLLSLGNNEINAGEADENMPIRNYIEGTKLISALMFQISYIEK